MQKLKGSNRSTVAKTDGAATGGAEPFSESPITTSKQGSSDKTMPRIRKRYAVERIRNAYLDRMAGTEDKDGMMASFGLTEIEAEVLQRYILAYTTQNASDTAAAMGISTNALNMHLRRIEGKLSGDAEMYLKKLARRKYGDTSDEELLKMAGGLTKMELRGTHALLQCTLKDRGIYDELPDANRSGTLDLIKNMVLGMQKDDAAGWGTLFRTLTPLEQDIINLRAMRPNPEKSGVIEDKYGLYNGGVLHAEQQLLKKLTGENLKGWNSRSNRMKVLVAKLGEEKMRCLRERLNPNELAILDRRVLLEKPRTLEEIGREIGLTKERIRQIENGLEVKLQKLDRTGDPDSIIKKRRRKYSDVGDEELMGMAKNCAENGERNNTLYKELGRRRLLDAAYLAGKRGRKRKYADVGDEELRRTAGDYRTKTECYKKDNPLHNELLRRKLLDATYLAGKRGRKRKYANVGDEELMEMAKALTRKKCREEHASLYEELRKRKLLDVVYPKKMICRGQDSNLRTC
ncbi:MAG: sigma factor-like helix-turn-helix DNA-binding protein [Candidatus Bilamarchaeaceae archaeon]